MVNQKIQEILNFLSKQWQINSVQLDENNFELDWSLSKFDHRTFLKFEISGDVLRVDIKHAFGHVNLERGVSGEDFLKMLLENVGTFQKTSAYLGIKVIDETPATLLLSCPIFLLKWESRDIADVIQLHLLDIKNGFIMWNFPDTIFVYTKEPY